MLAAALGFPSVVAGQTLRGSHASVELMYGRARESSLEFFDTPDDIYKAAAAGKLKLISMSNDVTLEGMRFPFVLPRTLVFITDLAKQYHPACGERLIVTSGIRPIDKQPRNASPESVHPTGMAVDLHRPGEPCLTWLRDALVELEDQHVIEATEEHRPPHFHIAVLAPSPTHYAVSVAPRPVQRAPVGAVSNGDVAAASDRASDRAMDMYDVRPGDNLSSIARRYHTTVPRLKELNQLATDELKAGQRLRVP